MKRNGFTLAELLGVIVILGVLAVITIPTVDKNLKQGKEDLYKTQIESLGLSLRSWAADNVFSLPEPGEEMTLTLAQLKQSGFADADIKNPKTKKPFPNDMLFTIRNNNGVYQYTVHEDSGTEGNTTLYDPNAPILILNGNAFENVEVYSTYTDKGVLAKSASGIVIDNSRVTVTISGSGNTISTNNIGDQYTITYSVMDNGLTTSIIRTVVIKDTLPPELTIPDNTTIAVADIGTFRLMDGVSATDNSRGSVRITTSGNISNIPMTYVISYTATDNSGNAITKRRTITVTP